MNLENLKSQCNNLIDARKLATSGEWAVRARFAGNAKNVYSVRTGIFGGIYEGVKICNVIRRSEAESEKRLADLKLICLAANTSASLADKLIKCIDALEAIDKSSDCKIALEIYDDILQEITK